MPDLAAAVNQFNERREWVADQCRGMLETRKGRTITDSDRAVAAHHLCHAPFAGGDRVICGTLARLMLLCGDDETARNLILDATYMAMRMHNKIHGGPT